MGRLAGKVARIPGGGTGQGATASEAVAAEGAAVLFTGIGTAGKTRVAEQVPAATGPTFYLRPAAIDGAAWNHSTS